MCKYQLVSYYCCGNGGVVVFGAIFVLCIRGSVRSLEKNSFADR